jgi:L-ascorbate metabolism protein UlaG (beta-lactamase superfamily)
MTDPILRNRITFLHRTRPAAAEALLQNIDIVLISHLHYDHLDIPSLRMLGDYIVHIVPRGARPVLRKNGFHDVQEIQIGEMIQFGALSVRAIYADHVQSRYPLGPSADCIGYVISGSAKVYYPGDTREFPKMAALAEEKLDLALMPVWGWGPDRGRMHMGPKEAAEALDMLRPRLAIPIHWGTYIPLWLRWTKPAFHYLPPLEFAAHAKQITHQVEVHILQPGESLSLGD